MKNTNGANAAAQPGVSEPSRVDWTNARTVGHLMQQLATLPTETGISAVYFVDMKGRRRARSKGVGMSWERIIEGGWLDYTRTDIDKSIVIWASEREYDLPELSPKPAPEETTTRPKVMRLVQCESDGCMYEVGRDDFNEVQYVYAKDYDTQQDSIAELEAGFLLQQSGRIKRDEKIADLESQLAALKSGDPRECATREAVEEGK